MSEPCNWFGAAWLAILLNACGGMPLRGTGDLGLVIERASGHVTLVNTSRRSAYARIGGLGDLSHASVVYSRDARYAFVFGRDGGLTKIDLLEARIVKRIMQSGNAIGGSISQDGRIVVAQNYTPGGIKAFDADTLELLAEVPAEYEPGRFSKVVGLADVPGNRFAYALFDGGEIWVSDFSDPKRPVTKRYPAGQQPYDGLVTPDGRHYLAGLFGEDGIACSTSGNRKRARARFSKNTAAARRSCRCSRCPTCAAGLSRRDAPGCRRSAATRYWWPMRRPGRRPAGGGQGPAGVRHGQPRRPPDLGQFRLPGQRLGAGDRHPERQGGADLQPGKAVLHMEFTPRGEAVWISARDDNRVVIYDTKTFRNSAAFPPRRRPASSSAVARRA
jgi:protein NirF